MSQYYRPFLKHIYHLMGEKKNKNIPHIVKYTKKTGLSIQEYLHDDTYFAESFKNKKLNGNRGVYKGKQYIWVEKYKDGIIIDYRERTD